MNSGVKVGLENQHTPRGNLSHWAACLIPSVWLITSAYSGTSWKKFANMVQLMENADLPIINFALDWPCTWWPIFRRKEISTISSNRLLQMESPSATAVTPIYPGWWPHLLLQLRLTAKVQKWLHTGHNWAPQWCTEAYIFCLNYVLVEQQQAYNIICACIVLHVKG